MLLHRRPALARKRQADPELLHCFSPLIRRLAIPILLVIASPVLSHAEYAVSELNAHMVVSFDHSEFDQDEPTDFRNELGTLTGVVSIPIDRELAARIFVSPFWQSTGGSGSTIADQVGSLARDTGGVRLGGDLFLRYPSTFEISIGPRYKWSDADGDTTNALGGEGKGALFFDGFGLGPVNLKTSAFIMDTDLGHSRQARGHEYGVSAGATVYLHPRFSVEANGFWQRLNQSGGRHRNRVGGGAELGFLVPVDLPLTLSFRASGGMLETKRDDDQSDAPYYSIGLAITISFPGADSLVELERHFY